MKLLPRLIQSRSRLMANLSVVGIASAAFLVVATNADGYKATNIDLNDGSVWVSDTGAGKVGRLNVRIDEMDFERAGLTSPDLIQEGRSVLIGDASGVATVDVQTGSYSPPKNLIPLADYQVGGGVGAVLDPATGKLWTGRSSSVVAPEYPKKASGQVGLGSEMVVTTTGRILIVDPSTSTWYEVELDEQGQPVRPIDPDTSIPADGASTTDASTDDAATDDTEVAADPLASGDTVPDTAVPIEPAAINVLENSIGVDVVVTAVGDEIVFLDTDGRVFGPTGKVAQVPGEKFVIQPPGPAADSVLVASTTGLYSIEIGSDSVEQLSADTGNPARPVRVGPCAYGAWAATPSTWFRDCRGKSPLDDVTIDGAGPDDVLVFRVNQNNIALNSTGNGGVWAEHDGRLVKVTNWGELQGEQANDDSTDTGNVGEEEAERECSDVAVSPTASDDELIGVRVRPSIIDVLTNDSDANCEPIAVATIEPGADVPGEILIVDNGQHVLFSPSSELRDGVIKPPLSFTFSYTVADSTGAVSEAATATVFVTDPTTNRPPELRTKGDGKPRKMRAVVESGKVVAYDVLLDWWDPDGDDIQLIGATVEPGGGAVTLSPNGTVRYEAFGVSSGIEIVNIRVSDGQPTTSDATGELEITVQPQGQAIKPVAKDDFITVRIGQRASVHLLENDSDGNFNPRDDKNKLSANLGDLSTVPAGLTDVRYDSMTDTLSVTGAVAGVYAISYTATDGTDTDGATVRVVVTDLPATNVAPVAVPDRVVIRPGRVINVDVLTNDIDLDGDLLALVAGDGGTFAPEQGGVRASVIDRRILQIELVASTTGAATVGPFFVSYAIDDGKSTAEQSHRAIGLLTVLVDSSTGNQQPTMVPDQIVVRTGDVGSVAVIANDSDPDGDRIELTGIEPSEAEAFVASGGGVIWVEKQVVRVRGGAPGSYPLHYTAISNGKPVAALLTVTVKAMPTESSINQAPSPQNLQVRVGRGTEVRIAIPLFGIDPDGDSVTLASFATPAMAASGSSLRQDPSNPNRLLYATTPQSAVTADSFTYTVTDRLKQASTATVEVLVVDVEPSAPVAHDDVMRAKPGRVVLVPVVLNDVDADDDPIALAELPFVDEAGQPTKTPANPDSVSVALDEPGGAVTGGQLQVVVPFADQANISERYRITDPSGNSSSAYVQVIPDEAAPNLAPTTEPDVIEDAAIRDLDTIDVDVLANDDDPDDVGAALILALPDAAAMPGVSASIVANKINVVLTDDPQLLVYIVTDLDPADPKSSYGVISLPGKANHPPHLTTSAQQVGAFTTESSPPKPITFSLADIVNDPDQDPGVILTATEISASTGMVTRSDDNLSFTYTPIESLTAYDVQLSFEVEDRPGDKTSITVPLKLTVSVSPGNTPPVFASAGQMRVPQFEEPVTFSLAGLMTDADEDPLDFVLTNDLPGFDVKLSGADLTVTSTSETVQVGSSFTLNFTATDNIEGHERVDGRLNITVIATNMGQPLAANISSVPAVRDEPAAGIDVEGQATNPFPKYPMTIESVSVSGTGASVGCTAACGQSEVVFTATLPGTFMVTYVLKDKIGQTATGTIGYVVKGRPLVPGVPQIEEVGDQKVLLNWTSADEQGAPITKYVITAVGSGLTKESTSTNVTFDGLTNAKPYQFTVFAVNEVGDGVVSSPSNSAIPDKVPDPPVNLRITDYQDKQLTLQWDPPSTVSNYSPINAYEINLAGFGVILVDGPITERVVTGLTNGVDYTFTVRARNSAQTDGGWGGSSGSSPAEHPSTYPGSPTGITAVTAGDGGQARVKVTWTAPASDGGRAITEYRVCSVQSPSTCIVDPNTREATFLVVTGSQNSYTVIAFNSDKNRNNSDTSGASNVVQGIVTPGAPTVNSVTPNDHQLTVSASPGPNGGCSTAFLEYTVNGSTWQANNVFAGLANGTAYTAQARMNLPASCQTPPTVTRTSAASNGVAQTPYGPLGQPTISSSVSGTTISWSWNANQGDNGRPWTVSVTGECSWNSSAGGVQTGSCPRDFGYSSGNRSVSITVSAPGVSSLSASSTNSTPPPPPPPPAVTVSRGGTGANNNGTTPCGACHWINVQLRNFAPNTTYYVTSTVGSLGDHNVTTNGNGSADVGDGYWYCGSPYIITASAGVTTSSNYTCS